VPPVCDKTKSSVCSCGGWSEQLGKYLASATYDNSCELAKIGVNLKAFGVCGGPVGGCIEGKGQCAAGQYCGVAKGQCGTKGQCIPKPVQPCPNVFAKVCGCDNQTYQNAGCAAEAGVIVKKDGACP
jgi:hypothetical protein